MNHTRDILTSPRVVELKKKRKRVKNRRLILFFIFFVSVVIGLSFLSHYEEIVVDQINISGNHVINEGDILKKVNEDLSGKYLYLFAKKNIFIYPKSKIYNDLIHSFPRIETLSISRGDLETLNINISERSGSFLWCGESVPTIETEVGENCYFINNQGYIFDKAPYFSGNLYFKFYIPLETSQDSPLAKQMLPEEEFSSLINFIDKLSQLGLNPVYLIFNDDNTWEICLDSKPGNTSPKIIFSNDDKNIEGLNKLSQNISLAMQKPSFTEEIRNKYDKLLYIDLRFKNKILYKFQQ